MYNYSEVEESHDMEYNDEKGKLKKEYLRRMRLILSTELIANSKIQTIGSLAVPGLNHTYGIINWHQGELIK